RELALRLTVVLRTWRPPGYPGSRGSETHGRDGPAAQLPALMPQAPRCRSARMDLRTRKAALRETAAKRRDAAHEAAQDAPQAARDHFLAAGLHEGAGIVSAYRAIRTELDPE